MLHLLAEHINPSTLEYERKFVVPAEMIKEIEQRLRLNSALFREIHMPVHITSYYFDTLNLEYYKANINGISRRLKVRVRSYSLLKGDERTLPGVLAPHRLEYKIRVGMQRTKISYICSHIDGSSTPDFVHKHLQHCPALPALIRAHFAILHPTVVIDYHRRYFRSLDNNVRLTIDTNVAYSHPQTCRNMKARDAVLEIKYKCSDEVSAMQVATQLGLRISRNSKYVNAVDALGQAV